MKGDKIMIVTNIPTPYRIPLFNEVDKRIKKRGGRFIVIFAMKTYWRRKFQVDMGDCQFEYEMLKSRTFGSKHRPYFSYSGLFHSLRKHKPDQIIIIGFSPGTMKTWLYSKLTGVPYIIWAGSIATKGRSGNFLRTIQRKIVINSAKSFIAYGSKAKEYFVSMGAPARKVFIAINTTDIHFYNRVKSLDNQEFVTAKKKLLSVGYITPGKRLDLLIRAVHRLSQKRNDFVLEIVGSGPSVNTISQLVKDLGIEDIVSFEGYRQRQEVRDYMAEAFCFLFPSEYDIWGMVVVEAMAAGLPCLSSIFSGSTADLIIEGETGFALNFNQIDQVVEKLDYLLEHPGKALEMGDKARKHVFEVASLAKSAEGFIRAIDVE